MYLNRCIQLRISTLVRILSCRMQVHIPNPDPTFCMRCKPHARDSGAHRLLRCWSRLHTSEPLLQTCQQHDRGLISLHALPFWSSDLFCCSGSRLLLSIVCPFCRTISLHALPLVRSGPILVPSAERKEPFSGDSLRYWSSLSAALCE